MVRISKQEERRHRCPHKHRPPSPKSGPKKDNLPLGYKAHASSLEDAQIAQRTFISKIK